MNQSIRQLFRVFGVCVAVVLVALAFYPGTLATSETVPEYTYSLTPESTDEYEYTVDRIDAQYDGDPPVYQYENLSPLVQALFDQTNNADPDDRYRTPVCTDSQIFCDGHSRSDLLDEEFKAFSLPEDIQTQDAFVFVEDGDDRYLLVMTQPGGHTESRYMFHLLLVGLTVIPAGIAVGVGALRSNRDDVLVGTVAGGLLVAVFGLSASSVDALGILSVERSLALLLVGVWTGIFTGVGYQLYRWAQDSERW